MYAITTRWVGAKPLRAQTLHAYAPLMAALAVYAFSLNAVNAYHWVLFHHPSPPDSPYLEGNSLALLSSLCTFFPGCTRVSRPTRTFISSMIAVVNTLFISL